MLELEHGFRVVDVHARLDPDDGAVVASRGRDITPERLQREMHQAGVVQSAVAPGPRPAGEGYLRANNAVARLSVDRPFRAMARRRLAWAMRRVLGGETPARVIVSGSGSALAESAVRNVVGATPVVRLAEDIGAWAVCQLWGER